MSGVAHLYVHLPFCSHRCGYCDFVTAVGGRELHGDYVDAVLAELELERDRLAPELETVFVGGGTPTFTERAALARLLDGLPRAAEVTVEANPETVDPGLARLLANRRVTRVSLGAQTFARRLLRVLERRSTPSAVRRAVRILRAAGLDNVSLDLVYGIPGQASADLERDLDAALELRPEHLSCYELEAKPGTRFTHAWGAELSRQADAMEGYLELVVDTLQGAGYRWYETANFCLDDRRSGHNLAYWLGRDYLGIGVGAVSTVGRERRRNSPGIARYVRALGDARRPPHEVEPLDEAVRLWERLMLALRLDQPLSVTEFEPVLDLAGLERLERLGLVERDPSTFRLTRRGRLLGTAATVELLSEIPANEPVHVG